MNSPSINQYPNKIRYYRLKAGLSYQQVASYASTTKSQIQKLERGERRLTVEWMERLAPVLGCKSYQLMPEFPDTPIYFELTDEHARELFDVVCFFRDQTKLAISEYRYWQNRVRRSHSFSFRKSYEGQILKKNVQSLIKIYRVAHKDFHQVRRKTLQAA